MSQTFAAGSFGRMDGFAGRLRRIPGLSPSRADTLLRLEALSRLLDNAFVLPGTKIRFGVDGLIGLVPGIGDLISAGLSGYLVWEARRLGLPRRKIARMIANVAFDAAIGVVPVLGDAADIMFKANRRNMRIIREHLEREGRGRPDIVDAEFETMERRR